MCDSSPSLLFHSSDVPYKVKKELNREPQMAKKDLVPLNCYLSASTNDTLTKESRAGRSCCMQRGRKNRKCRDSLEKLREKREKHCWLLSYIKVESSLKRVQSKW